MQRRNVRLSEHRHRGKLNRVITCRLPFELRFLRYLLGGYAFSVPEAVQRAELRSLRRPSAGRDICASAQGSDGESHGGERNRTCISTRYRSTPGTKYLLRDKLKMLNCYMRARTRSFLRGFNHHSYFIELLPANAMWEGKTEYLLDSRPIQRHMSILTRTNYQTPQRLRRGFFRSSVFQQDLHVDRTRAVVGILNR